MKGIVFEELVQRELQRQGYEEPDDEEPKIDLQASSVEGRGADHDMDAFGLYGDSVPFVHPIRLLAEVKNLQETVGINHVREAIVVLKDASESYAGSATAVPSDRRTDCVAIFSTSGFSTHAQKLAFSHRIYLVSFGHLNSIINHIMTSYQPTTHQEVAEAVADHYEPESVQRPYVGSYAGSHPVGIVADPIPAQPIETADVYRAESYPIQDSPNGTARFGLRNTSFDWTGALELPQRLTTDDGNIRDGPESPIILPLTVDERNRRVRIVLTEKHQPRQLSEFVKQFEG